jgi:hypothetical protein
MDPRILKRVENRNWRWEPKFRGPLLIHAGKSISWLDSWDGPCPEQMPFGAIVGQVDLTHVFWINNIRAGAVPDELAWLHTHQHATGPLCLVLSNPQRFLEPIPYRGQQSIFDVPDDLLHGNQLVPAIEK